MSMQPGWYPDPFSSGGYVRWWDGQRWGASTSVTTSPADPPVMAPGAPLPPPAVPASWPAPGSGPTAGIALASWWSRAGGKVIDLLLQALVTAPFAFVLLRPAFGRLLDALPSDGTEPTSAQVSAATEAFQSDVLASALALSALSLAVSFLYEVPQNVRWGRTIGMRATGIRIRPFAADGPVPWVTATIRWGTWALGSLLPYGIFTVLDYLWPLWDKPWQQALHDKTARTLVVRHTP
jgi:hypothetical protein